jgi:hypothetical protein
LREIVLPPRMNLFAKQAALVLAVSAAAGVLTYVYAYGMIYFGAVPECEAFQRAAWGASGLGLGVLLRHWW